MVPEHLTDVRLPLQAILDRKFLSMRELLGLREGTVLRLARSAGENVDLVIDQQLIGYGEIVVIEESVGFRVTDIYKEK